MKRKVAPGVKSVKISSATPDMIERFNATNKHKHGPTIKNFVLDLAGRGTASPWNKRAAVIFAEHFLRLRKYTCCDEDKVYRAFMTHIVQLKTDYKNYVNGAEKSGEMLEKDTVRNRLARRRTVRSLASAHLQPHSCYPQLRQRRADICAAFAQDPCMKRFHQLLRSLPLAAVSGDETDHRGRQLRYNITTLSWRSPEIRRWMQVLDDLHLSTRFSTGNRATAGKFPHVRIHISERNERHLDTPVAGLPRNFYNQDWMDSLDRRERAALRIQEPVDLSFSPDILR
jgi:hypothetical protein